ncbi:MAG: hypothetical protein WDW36_005239 [Sanguina aurantia]
MPPKKKEEEKERPLLGRFKTSLKMGIVGLPNVGEGLGNAFLSHISQVDGIYHVCRTFEDPDVIHVEDRVDPVADLEIIHQELRLKDIERVEGISNEWKRASRGQKLTKDQEEERDLCDRLLTQLKAGTDVRFGDYTMREVDLLNTYQLLTAKPVVYLVNLSEEDFCRKKNKWLIKIHEWVKAHGGEPILPFSGIFENNIVDMPEDEKAIFCKEKGAVSALPKIITAGFKAIHLIYFFTCGVDEVKCWQIRKGTKAPQAAGTIHTDFEKGFICAEVMKFEDLKELGSEVAAKAGGKYRQEGKNYTVEDGDVIFFKFGRT